MADTGDGCVSSRMEAEVEDEVGSSQPATQPLSFATDLMSDEDDDLSSNSSQDLDKNRAWGMLYPIRDHWRSVELSSDNELSLGRSTGNSHVISSEEAGGSKKILGISKVQFVIKKTKDGVELHDKSSNGTKVNDKLVGKGKKRLLEHNATITMAEMKAYVYMSTSEDYQRDYPVQVRKAYVISKQLGSGACGVVRLAFRKRDMRRVAVKIVNKKNSLANTRLAILNEVKVLRAVNHPCIIRLEDVIDTDDRLYIVLELADGGELFDKIIEKTRLNEFEAKLHFYQMVSAIEYLHSHSIAHRDLKPENILLCSDDDANPVIKITDMGLSKLVDTDSLLKTFCGTPQYLAPEVLINRVRSDGTYDFKVDMWSLGVILYILLCGAPPFNPDRPDKPLLRQICDGDYSFPKSKWTDIGDTAKDLVRKLMTVDQKQRLSAKQALQHPWLQDEKVVQKAKQLMESQTIHSDVNVNKKRKSGEENRDINNRCKRIRFSSGGGEEADIGPSQQ